jgi:hypothetical protein
MWSSAGQLDWWVKEGQEWWGRLRGADAVNGGSEPLIFVPPNANDRDVWGMKPQRSGPPDDLLIVASSVRSSVRASGTESSSAT